MCSHFQNVFSGKAAVQAFFDSLLKSLKLLDKVRGSLCGKRGAGARVISGGARAGIGAVSAVPASLRYANVDRTSRPLLPYARPLLPYDRAQCRRRSSMQMLIGLDGPSCHMIGPSCHMIGLFCDMIERDAGVAQVC